MRSRAVTPDFLRGVAVEDNDDKAGDLYGVTVEGTDEAGDANDVSIRRLGGVSKYSTSKAGSTFFGGDFDENIGFDVVDRISLFFWL